MKDNPLVRRDDQNYTLSVTNESLASRTTVVRYSLVDYTRYSFGFKLDDDTDVNAFETDRAYNSDEFVDAEFDDAVTPKDRSYYVLAATSGVITGVFSQIGLPEKTLAHINELKKKDWEKLIINAAQLVGYDKSDYKKAVAFLKNRVVDYVDQRLNEELLDGWQECLNNLSNHPSIAGLIFSVLTQFGGVQYKLDEQGLVKEELPEYYAIGRNTAEKITYAFLYWAYYLVIDDSVSERPVLDELTVPKEIIRLLKELCRLDIFKKSFFNYKSSEEQYSRWIKKIFENTNLPEEDKKTRLFDLEKEIKILETVNIRGYVPVLINECLVRCFYTLKKFIIQVKEKEIRSLDELNKIDAADILPFNNRLVSRMVLISSSCFAAINVAGATVKAILNKDKKDGEFAKALLTEVNVAGVGRFVFAVIADSKYWGEDIRVFFQRKENQRKEKKRAAEDAAEESFAEEMASNEAFKVLSLTPAQARALYSLETVAVMKDIEHTENSDVKAKKQLWLETWQNNILAGMGIETEEYFVTDEKTIYDAIYSLDDTADNLRWFYLLAGELIVFKPYYPLGSKDDAVFRKLNREKYNYIDDQFARRQTIVNQVEIESIRGAYKNYKDIISRSTQGKIIAAGVATLTAFATGGLAFALAPKIAILLAGEAVVGLHGAALTSASLAFVGGGSLAAGGLGMAGGTAIITGGGALLGVAGSGSASMAVLLSQTNNEYWVRQAAKLLMFSKCVLKARLNDSEAINGLLDGIKQTIRDVEYNIKDLEDEKCSLDKDVIKNSKDCLKYLGRCMTELEKLK